MHYPMEENSYERLRFRYVTRTLAKPQNPRGAHNTRLSVEKKFSARSAHTMHRTHPATALKRRRIKYINYNNNKYEMHRVVQQIYTTFIISQ